MFVEDFIDNCKDERLSCYALNDMIKDIAIRKKIIRKLQAVESNGENTETLDRVPPYGNSSERLH